jgi:acetylornithine deacetylase/succinyl-diaminopimelate desuccinylase-like protein
MHLDGQPVVDKEWSQPSPWRPVVKKRNSQGAWEIADTELLFAASLDPELRVFARASADDKGPIMMFLAAFDGLRQAGLDPSFPSRA